VHRRRSQRANIQPNRWIFAELVFEPVRRIGTCNRVARVHCLFHDLAVWLCKRLLAEALQSWSRTSLAVQLIHTREAVQPLLTIRQLAHNWRLERNDCVDYRRIAGENLERDNTARTRSKDGGESASVLDEPSRVIRVGLQTMVVVLRPVELALEKPRRS
jgi:hypothetical protein